MRRPTGRHPYLASRICAALLARTGNTRLDPCAFARSDGTPREGPTSDISAHTEAKFGARRLSSYGTCSSLAGAKLSARAGCPDGSMEACSLFGPSEFGY